MRPNIIINRISILYCFLFSFMATFYFSIIAQSKIIWQVGIENENSEELLSCGEYTPSNKRIIDYRVPLDWKSRLGQEGQVWGNFPSSLYPYQGETNCPQEIRINYNYLKEYSNPVLRIMVSASQQSVSQYIEVYKGRNISKETLIGKKLLDLPYYTFYDFPLGRIKIGLQEENRITIRNISYTEGSMSNIFPVIFDDLYLDDNEAREVYFVNVFGLFSDVSRKGIMGQVVDSHGKGISGLRIRVKDVHGTFDKSTPTICMLGSIDDQEKGYFYISDVTINLNAFYFLQVCTYDPPKLIKEFYLPPPLLSFYRFFITEPISESSSEYYKALERIREIIINFTTYYPPSGDHDFNLPPEGDFDGDGIPNWDEIMTYHTPLHIPTVPLYLSEGMNIYHFPSIIDRPNILTNSSTSSQVYYYYDPDSKNWKENPRGFKPNCFNAIHTSEPGLLYLNLTSGKPLLYLRGFLKQDYFSAGYPNPIDGLDRDLFHSNYFDPNTLTLTILDNPNLSNIKMISRQNPQNGRWESSYRFFGSPAGKDIRTKLHEVYIVTKGIEEIK